MEIVVLVIVFLVFGFLGAWIADQKHRDGGEGFFLGLLFGPLGVLVEALLPSVLPPAAMTPEQIERDRLKRVADDERFYAGLARERQETEARLAANRAIWAARRTTFNSRAKSTCRWLDRWVVRFGWYRKLPELPRLIVRGLGCATPIVVVVAWMFSGGR